MNNKLCGKHHFRNNVMFITIYLYVMVGCSVNVQPTSSTSNDQQNISIAVTETVQSKSLTTLTPIVVVTPTPRQIILTPINPPTASLNAPSEITTSIYFVARKGRTKSQIWQIEPNGSSASVLYELTKDLDTPASEVIPADEVKFIETTLAELTADLGRTPEVLPGVRITNLTLSPTREALVWKELDQYCVQNTSRGCAGVTRLMALDLETHNIKVLFELPSSGDTSYISNGPAWSSNGRYIAIIRDIEPTESTPMVFDVETGEVKEFTTAIEPATLMWSPDSSQIAWLEYEQHNTIYIHSCTFSTEVCEDIKFDDYSSTTFANIEWGPYGEEIIYTGDGGYGLYLLNPMSGSVRKVPSDVEGTTENAHWSPDGQTLAIDNRLGINPSDPVEALLVIDPNSGRVINQLHLGYPESEWIWGHDSNSILVLTGDSSTGYELGIFNTREGTLTPVPLPDDLVGKAQFETITIKYLNW